MFSTTVRTRRPTTRSAAGSLPAPASPVWSHRLGRIVAEIARRDAPRRVLWLPVALGMGVGGYFAVAFEPPPWAGPIAVALAVALSALPAVRRRSPALWCMLLLAVAMLGFTVAQLRTLMLSTAMLQHEIRAEVEGRVTAIERRPGNARLTLADVVDAGQRPMPGVRVTIAGRSAGAGTLRVGDRIRLRAALRPPPAPVAPGAFDFQRAAYFRGIGAVGFAIGPVATTDAMATGLGEDLWTAIDALRDTVAVRIRTVLPGPAGGVAAAMLVGDRAGIDEDTDTAFRETGLAHLLAISGLHMGMVAGAVFAAVRLALAAWPAVALRRPIKKWSAAAALAATFLYLLLSGAPVPAQRAFVMTAMLLTAVLLDRDALSLHMVAWAAVVVLLLAPESLTGPSFQLSFAAVIALVAAWEGFARRRRRRDRSPNPVLRAASYVGGVAATSLVASLATAPIIAHHFQQVPVLGSVANLAAVPLTAFVTMPAGAVAVAAMPAGLDAWPLAVMGWSIDATLWVAARVADGPLAAVGVPALGTVPLCCIGLGGLWLALWRSAMRWLGVPALLAGLALGVGERPPDVLISGDGRLAAVRLAGEGWLVSSDQGNGFVRDAWRRRAGGGEALTFAAADTGDGRGDFGCDGLGCVLRMGRHSVALPATAEAAREDCRRADVLVAPFNLRASCTSAAIVIDRAAIDDGGAHALWLTGQAVRVRSVDGTRGDRPWVVRPTTPRRVALRTE